MERETKSNQRRGVRKREKRMRKREKRIGEREREEEKARIRENVKKMR